MSIFHKSAAKVLEANFLWGNGFLYLILNWYRRNSRRSLDSMQWITLLSFSQFNYFLFL